MKHFDNAIVITGTIGSGKSSVAKILKEFGFIVIDADKITHKLLDKNYKKIANIFGTDFVSNRRVRRKKLGALVFSNPNKLKILENFLYPKIKQKIIEIANKFIKKKLFFIDIPLYFEKGNFKNIFKRVLVVYTPNELILKRLIKRDNLNEEEAKKRIDLQIDIEEKIKLATYVIKNTTHHKKLQEEVENFLKDIDANF